MFRIPGRCCSGALVLCGLVVSLQLGGCADTMAQQTEGTEVSSKVIECTDPRPQICTMMYDPVCATLKSGAKRTYASGCTACADAKVVSYQPKECE